MLRAALMLLALLSAPAAQAYLCSRVPPQGPSLWWGSRELPYSLHRRGYDGTAGTPELEAARASFATWEDVDCTDLRFAEQALSDARLVGYNWAEPADNQNLIIWRHGGSDDPTDAWRHERGSIAVTTTTFNSRTGELLDADIELNAEVYTFTACTPPEPGCTVRYDVQNTLTHEIGHVLGLDHPPLSQPGVTDATMYHSAPSGEVKKRDLADDDVDGLCFLYPQNAAAGHCYDVTVNTGPEPTFTQVGQDSDTGCLCRGPSAGPGAGRGLFAVLGILLLALWRRLT